MRTPKPKMDKGNSPIKKQKKLPADMPKYRKRITGTKK